MGGRGTDDGVGAPASVLVLELTIRKHTIPSTESGKYRNRESSLPLKETEKVKLALRVRCDIYNGLRDISLLV